MEHGDTPALGGPADGGCDPDRRSSALEPPERMHTLVASAGETAIERRDTLVDMPEQSSMPDGWTKHTVMFTSPAEFVLPSRYSDIRKISAGAVGLVAQAFDISGGELVAIKKIRGAWDSRRQAKCTFRELRLLRYLQLNWSQFSIGEALVHDNVMGMINCFIPPTEPNDMYIVMEHGGRDLNYVMQTLKLGLEHIQFYGYQVACGLKHVHSSGIIHRDLKPSNIAVSDDNDLKILDFGLARLNEPDETTSTNGYISTRPYRAPEVALHVGHQGSSLDMWSFGVILGELVYYKACRDRNVPYRLNLFEAADMLDQLKKIAQVIGPPSESYIQTIDPYAQTWLRSCNDLMDQPSRSLDETDEFEGADPVALDLLSKLLQWDPSLRLSAEETLAHPFFAEHHDDQFEPVCAAPFNDEYEHNSDSLTATDWRLLCVRELKGYHRMSSLCSEVNDIRSQLFPPDDYEEDPVDPYVALPPDEIMKLESRQESILDELEALEADLSHILADASIK